MANERAVIPPGHEQMLSAKLSPPSSINGFELESIQILKNDIRLLFKMDDKSATFLLSLNEADDLKQNCNIVGKLLLCKDSEAYKTLALAYTKYLLDGNKDARIAKAWNRQAKAKDTGKKISAFQKIISFKKITVGKVLYDPTPQIWLVIIFGVFVFVLFAGFIKFSNTEKKLNKILLLVLADAFLIVTLSMLGSILSSTFFDTGLSFFSVLLLFATLYYLLKYQGQQVKLLLYQTKDTHIWFFFAIALIMAIGMSGNLPHFFNNIIGHLKQSWIDSNTLRAVFHNIYFYLLSLTIIGLIIHLAREEKHFFSKLLILLFTGLLLVVHPGWQLIENIGFSRPGSIWLELQPGLQLATGELEHFGQYLMGAAFLSGSFFDLFGTNIIVVNIFKFACLFFAITSIAISSRILFKSNLSAFVAAALFVLNPAMPQIAFQSWWFFLATGFISLSVSITVLAARRRSLALSFLAILLIQFAFEIRMEAVILFVLFYLIQMLYDFPNKSLCRLVLPIFSINLFRMLLISFGEGHLNAQIVEENAWYYLCLFGDNLPVFVLMIFGFIFSYKSFPKSIIVLLAWLLGLLLLYGATQSRPSHSEVILIVSPIFLLISAMFAHNKKRVRVDRIAYAVSGLLAFIMIFAYFYVTENSRNELQAWSDRKLETGRQSLLLFDNLPDNEILLVDSTYLSFVFPKRRLLYSTQRRRTIDEINTLLLHEEKAYCFNDEKSPELCCFYELGRDRDKSTEYSQESCWNTKLLDRQIKVVAKAGNLRLLELKKSH